ncbi:MAG: hypothetical protein DRI73_01200 [Bacteroidetes bacterium]|nr:MAG: hypothetical protein DRI73_01200 [Bacteroidota bacterium]
MAYYLLHFQQLKTNTEMRNIFSLLILFILPSLLDAQVWQTEINDLRDLTYFTNRNMNDYKVKNNYNDIEGSPFLFDDFKKGEALLKNGNLFKGEFRYDKYADQVEFKVKQGIFWIAYPAHIEYLKIDTTQLIFIQKNAEQPDKGSYYIVLVSGKIQLLLKESVLLQSAEDPKPYVDAQPAKFVNRKNLYYLLDERNTPIRISGKKVITNELSDKSPEISRFIKSNKISYKKEKDLIHLINYYNSL